MSNKPTFSIKLALSTGWQVYKSNFGFLIVTFILYAIITGVLNGAQSYLREQGSVLVAIPSVLSMAVSSLLGVGLVRMGLKLLNGEKAEYEDLFLTSPFTSPN